MKMFFEFQARPSRLRLAEGGEGPWRIAVGYFPDPASLLVHSAERTRENRDSTDKSAKNAVDSFD